MQPDRITVSHNAIDPAWLAHANREDPGLRQRLGLKGVVIGFVGTMNRWQGIPKFGEVVSSVLARHPDASFLFVGDGEFRQTLEDTCRASAAGIRLSTSTSSSRAADSAKAIIGAS